MTSFDFSYDDKRQKLSKVINAQGDNVSVIGANDFIDEFVDNSKIQDQVSGLAYKEINGTLTNAHVIISDGDNDEYKKEKADWEKLGLKNAFIIGFAEQTLKDPTVLPINIDIEDKD